MLVPARHGEWLGRNVPNAEVVAEDGLGHLGDPELVTERLGWLVAPVSTWTRNEAAQYPCAARALAPDGAGVRHPSHTGAEGTPLLTASSTAWQVGLVLGIVVIAVAAAIVITIVLLATRIAAQAKTAEQAVEVVRAQTDELGGIARINDSGVRILHSARALRKAAVGQVTLACRGTATGRSRS